MTRDEAVRIVAAHIAADLIEDVSDEWAYYPEIGENDWSDVVAEVSSLLSFPDPSEFDEAYAFLTARSERAL